ncbi:MAG: patatin-like phospholipase family protein [Clostridium sp.]
MELIRILSIDGGGIRGVIPSRILITLEKLIQEYSGRKDARIGEYFDFIAGTSTGGILTALYLYKDEKRANRAKFSAEEVYEFYKNEGRDIFYKPIAHIISSVMGIRGSKYSSELIEKKARDIFGDSKLSELLKPCLITAYDIKSNKTMFFNQSSAIEDENKDFYIRDVIKSTSAAPTYFEPAIIKSIAKKEYIMIDGGVFANNPTMCAYVEASKLKKNINANKVIILSLGTGVYKKNYEINKNSGALKWAIPLFNINMSGVSDAVDYQLRTTYKSVNKNYYYLRIQGDLSKYPRGTAVMDNTLDKNIKSLEGVGDDLTKEYKRELDNFAKLLVYEDFTLIRSNNL